MVLREQHWAGMLGVCVAAACATAPADPDGGFGGASVDAGSAIDAPIQFPDAPVDLADAATRGPDAGSPDAMPSSPDAMPSPPDAMPSPPDAMPPPPDGGIINVTLSQTTSDSILAGNSVACVSRDPLGQPRANGINRYFRVFDLTEEGINGPLSISEVTFGVETADGASGSQPATVLLYTVSGTGTPTVGSLTQVASKAITVVDQTRAMLNVAIDATIPANGRFAVELSIPDGSAAPDLFFFGSNAGGETSPAYMVAPGCNINEMTDADSLNTDNTMHLVMKVTGSYFP